MNELQLSSKAAGYIATTIKNQILTILMNRPEKLNGWTLPMIEALQETFSKAAKNDAVKAVIFSGAGNYFSAGVDLGGSLKPMHPRKLHQAIKTLNQQLFEIFLLFPKPILSAINGPAIGASVTSSTLCDAIIASESATFSTPFAKLGVPPEGCSSVQFPRLLGEQNAQRMIGEEGWKPNAQEALEIGLVQWVVPHQDLLNRANEIASVWISENKARTFPGDTQKSTKLAELRAINIDESVKVADGILSAAFLKQQSAFFWKKKKRLLSILFFNLWLLRPVWSRFL
ncbi:enoyl-CoA hydratase/isomerase family protein [Aliikangiella sp. G2MR2-5]|uniref:enoyl-CoA hydratase/isomerase family protein n=1 Tax=Aliikangiella sp. G2MR2-5 TaxID=2788943 RepID=UPI0018AA7F43